VTDHHQIPPSATFESGVFPVEVIIIWTNEGGWHAGTVLSRIGADQPVAHAPWDRPFIFHDTPGQWEQTWRYVAGRVRDGSGGNGYTYELEPFEIAYIGDIESAVTAREAEVVAASHGPFGEIAGTILPGEGDLPLSGSFSAPTKESSPFRSS